MIHAGRYHTLRIARVSSHGLYLTNNEGDDVLLPNRFIPSECGEGDALRVFVYHDSEGRLIATTEQPLAAVGDFAALRVKDKTPHGAFLDWGLSGKDLFLPNRNMIGGVVIGQKYLVRLYEDNRTGRTVATMHFGAVLSNEELSVKEGDQVEAILASASEIGYRAIVNRRHWGMLYRNQIFRPVEIGETLTCYVRHIREDHRIDLSLQQQGYDEVKLAAEKLLSLLRDAGGCMPIGDRSDPTEVSRLTGMSKKVFKRSAGLLMKRGEATISDNEIKSTEKR